MSNHEESTNETARTGNQDLIEQFSRLQWLMMRSHLHNHRQHGPMGNPHRGQGRVLKLLSMRPEISQKELTFLLDMRPQSLGELLTKLERSGYITREPSASDRRVMNIQLTEQGKEAAADVESKGSQDELFSCLNDEEQATLSGYLTRLIEALESQLGDEDERFDWNDRRGFLGGHDPRCEGRHGFGPDDMRGHGFGPDGMRRDGRFMPMGGMRGGFAPRGPGFGEHPKNPEEEL